MPIEPVIVMIKRIVNRVYTRFKGEGVPRMLPGIEYGAVIDASAHVTVRDGRQPSLDRDVLIVELDAEAANSAAVSDVAWWQRLRNPHLVEIVTALHTGDGLTLVLDQAACLTLRTVPRLERPAQAVVVCQALEALATIHDTGHAHGKIGLDSVLVDRNGMARLAIPGLASSATGFRAPELPGADQRTPPGDLFAAGKVLEHLAGPDAQRWAPIIFVATASDPGARYPTAGHMHQAIDHLMTEEEGRDWAALALGSVAAATTTLLLTAPAGTSAGSITVTGSYASPPVVPAPQLAPPAFMAPPPPPPPPLPPVSPPQLVPLRAKTAWRQVKRARLVAAGGAAAVVAAAVAALVVFNHGTASRTAAPPTVASPTTTVGPTTTVASTAPPVTTVAAPPSTAAPVTAAFDPNGLPQPIATTPTSWEWTAPTGMTIADSTVAGDVVVVDLTDANGSATVVALRNGSELWRHPMPIVTGLTEGTTSNLTATNDGVVVAYNVGGTLTTAGSLGLASLDIADGTERWSQQLANASAYGLLRGPGNVILVGATLFDDSQTAAIDSTDGHVLWDINTAGVIGTVTDVRDDRAVVAYWRDNVSNVVDIHSGQLLFKADGQSPRLAEPVLYTMSGGFGCSDPDCSLEGNDATTGTSLWRDLDQTGVLVGVSRDGDAIVAHFADGASVASQLTSIGADGTTRWAVPTCGSTEVAAYDVGIMMNCGDNGLVLFDNDTGAEVHKLAFTSSSSFALAAAGTVFTVVGTNVTATRIGPDDTALWSTELPPGFTPYTPIDFNLVFDRADSAVRAFDQMLVVKGTVGDGRSALVVLTDRAPTKPAEPGLTLADITSGADVSGSVGPYAMADGTRTVVVTHSDPPAAELGVERADGWHIEQTVSLTSVGAPFEVGDLNGDGRPEIVVPSTGVNGGAGTETLFRIDDVGPTLTNVPFVTDPTTGETTDAVQITLSAPGHVTTLYDPCDPVCGSDPPTTVDWVLDDSASWFMHPTQPLTPPTALPTVCIRSNIDFAALRATPDLAGDLLAEIPPGSCDVTLVDLSTVQGNGFPWYHVHWNGVDGWTAKSNTV